MPEPKERMGHESRNKLWFTVHHVMAEFLLPVLVLVDLGHKTARGSPHEIRDINLSPSGLFMFWAEEKSLNTIKFVHPRVAAKPAGGGMEGSWPPIDAVHRYAHSRKLSHDFCFCWVLLDRGTCQRYSPPPT